MSQSRDPRYYVVGFIDDEASLQHKQIDGFRVLGDHHHLEVLARLYRIQELFVAMPNISPGRLDRVQELCQHLNISLLRFVPRTVQEITPLNRRRPGERGAFLFHGMTKGQQGKNSNFTRGNMVNRVEKTRTASPNQKNDRGKTAGAFLRPPRVSWYPFVSWV